MRVTWPAALGIAFLAVVGTLVIVGHYTGLTIGGLKDKVLGTDEKVIVNQQVQVQNNQLLHVDFGLDAPADVTLTLSVTQGNGVTAYLMTPDNYQKLVEAKTSLFGGQFAYIQPFSMEKTKGQTVTGRLPAGRYTLALQESSPVALLESPASATVMVKLTAKATGEVAPSPGTPSPTSAPGTGPTPGNRPGYLGIEFEQTVTLGMKGGVTVTKVEPGSPAANAGILVGHVLTRMNDEEIKDAEEFRRRLSTEGPGSRVTFLVGVGMLGHSVTATLK